jgi:hypothetical protein
MKAVRPLVPGEGMSEPRRMEGPMPSSETFGGIKVVPGVPVFELVVNAKGVLESVVSLRPRSADFDARIGGLLKEWRFEPAKVNGTPICVSYIMTLHINWQ